MGYCDPPIARRFKKGESGNSKGRPRGSKNLSSLLQEVLKEKLVLKEGENGRRVVTKAKAVIIRLVNSGLKGDMPAIRKIMDVCLAIEAQAIATPEPTDRELSPGDLEMLEAYLERKKSNGGP